MVPVCFCVFWLRPPFFSPWQILRCKTRRQDSSGSVPSHDFLFSLEEINGPCCSPLEALFIGALLFSSSLLGPVVPRSHVRTDYTAVRHCSVSHSGFALSGRAPHYYSAGDFKHFPNSFWCSLMHSHARHSVSSRLTGCVWIIKALLTHMITGMAHWHMPSPLSSQTLIFFFFFLPPLHLFSLHFPP